MREQCVTSLLAMACWTLNSLPCIVFYTLVVIRLSYFPASYVFFFFRFSLVPMFQSHLKSRQPKCSVTETQVLTYKISLNKYILTCICCACSNSYRYLSCLLSLPSHTLSVWRLSPQDWDFVFECKPSQVDLNILPLVVHCESCTCLPVR